VLTRVPAPGFTLIELVVTLAVFGLLATAVAPDVSAWLRQQRVRQVASSLQSGLQAARAEAVRRNSELLFSLVALRDARNLDNACTLNAQAQGWVVSQDSPVSACAAAPGGATSPRLVRAAALGTALTSVQVSALAADGRTAATQVRFDGLGQVRGAGAIAQITVADRRGDDVRALALRVSTGGQVRLCEPAVTAADDPRRC